MQERSYDSWEIAIEPIGEVRNAVTDLTRRDWEDVVSDLVVRPELEEALSDLEEFSHIIVIYWMHKVPKSGYHLCRVHPRKRQDLPLVGLLSSRSPTRPNPLGVSVVKLLEHRGSILVVEGLDAIDGTPILDIKPYMPRHDAPQDVTVPEWVTRVEKQGH